LSFAEIFGVIKLDSLGYRVALFVGFYVLAVSVEHRLVTDGRTDGQTQTRRQLIPALAIASRG